MAVIILLLHMAPYVIQGENTRIQELDNLDQPPLAIINNLKDSGLFWFGPGNAPIESIMNGISRGTLLSELKIQNVIYYFLNPFEAYVVSKFIGKIVAFFGAYLFIGLFLDRQKYAFVCVAGALYYALLPHFMGCFLTISMAPFIIYALWNIGRGKACWIDWIAITIYPLSSELITLPIYILMVAAIVLLLQLMKTRLINYHLLLGLAWMSLLYFVSEYRLINTVLFTDFVSHRLEMTRPALLLVQSVYWASRVFWKGHFHSNSLHYPFVFWTILLSWIAAYSRYRCLSRAYHGLRKSIRWKIPSIMKINPANALNDHVDHLLIVQITSIALALGISVCLCLYRYWPIYFTIRSIPVFGMVNWSRIEWIFPVIWIVVFTHSIAILWISSQRSRNIACAMIIIQIVFVAGNAEYIKFPNPFMRWDKWRYDVHTACLLFIGYYAQAQMKEIKDYIGGDPSEYRVAAFGLRPSVLSYNGFYCLDNYTNNYPLEYKHQFRNIIAPELAKSKVLKYYFDNWGNRCYLFSAQLGRSRNYSTQTKDIARPVETPDYNLDAFQKLGGKYILSAVELIGSRKKGLKRMRVFTHEDSVWDIHLYRVVSTADSLSDSTE